jgi:DNA-binding GntR family transcriptional regulator
LAYREIRRRILENRYTPSQQVLEHELAADLGMSRTPVREALVRLQNENFVQIVPRHGMRVVPLSLRDLYDMYEVLTALELTAIDRLVKSRPDGRVLRPLEEALDEMDSALAQGSVDRWVKGDESFHRLLIDGCGNLRLAAMANSIWEQGHRARTATVRLRPDLAQSNREHRALVDAIRKGDARTARSQHAKHRERTSGEIMRLLEQTRLGSF